MSCHTTVMYMSDSSTRQQGGHSRADSAFIDDKNDSGGCDGVDKDNVDDDDDDDVMSDSSARQQAGHAGSDGVGRAMCQAVGPYCP